METDSKSIITPDQPVTMGQLLQLVSQLNTNKPPTETIANTPSFSISEKLNHQNYTKWSRLMHLAISGRGRPQSHHRRTTITKGPIVQPMGSTRFNCHLLDNRKHRSGFGKPIPRFSDSKNPMEGDRNVIQ